METENRKNIETLREKGNKMGQSMREKGNRENGNSKGSTERKSEHKKMEREKISIIRMFSTHQDIL